MTQTPRNAPCPCGSGEKYKNCHGAAQAAAPPAPPARPASEPADRPVENPFRRIFRADGTVDQEYILSRLQHLEELMKSSERFFPLRFDREEMERLLGERQDLFQSTSTAEEFEAAFQAFAEAALPALVTKEFDDGAKEALRAAIQDPELTRRDRAAAACGLVLTLPAEGAPPQPHHRNPLFDLVLRVTYNESVARAEFLAKLAEDGGSEMERDAKSQEFLRSMPALAFELKQGFRNLMRKALASYERGEYSFGIGMDMIVRGLRASRSLTQEYREVEGDAFTDTQKKEFADRFGAAMSEAFAEDIGEEEEREVFFRMLGFLEGARGAGATKASKGLTSALTLMENNAEIRHRLLLAAYHEAVTGSRIFRGEEEEECAQRLFREPFDVESYLEYGEFLSEHEQPVRAERIYRAALEFFPENGEVRERLAAVAEALAPVRDQEFREEQERWKREEEGEEE